MWCLVRWRTPSRRHSTGAHGRYRGTRALARGSGVCGRRHADAHAVRQGCSGSSAVARGRECVTGCGSALRNGSALPLGFSRANRQ
eukprot:1537459-Alexandrium_andersonii.AAC.1